MEPRTHSPQGQANHAKTRNTTPSREPWWSPFSASIVNILQIFTGYRLAVGIHSKSNLVLQMNLAIQFLKSK
jgi:hypothetical protein